METFLQKTDSSIEDILSHDSGIGSNLPVYPLQDKKYRENENAELEVHVENYEKIISLNEELFVAMSKAEKLDEEINAMKYSIDKQDIEELTLESEIASISEEIEMMSKLNTGLGSAIKKNDFSLSHMVKNFEGRKAFLKTTEFDINREESHGKRLQIEFT